MTEIAVWMEYYTYTTREIDPDDSWDIGDSAMDVSCVGASIFERSDSIPISYKVKNVKDHFEPGDTGYVIWAHYNTGCTFGSSEEFEIMDVVKDKDRADSLYNMFSHVGRDTFTIGDYYIPWTGYFESLKHLYVTEVVMR